MITVNHLNKSYGTVQALFDVSFAIGSGEIVGLLGPNGAGKTTIIKTITGHLQPDEGEVTVDDLNVLTQTKAVQARIGYLPESAPLYPELTVREYLEMMASLRQIPEADVQARLIETVQATNLTQRLNQPIGQLSKGYRQRVGLAQAILHQPRLLILDEPTIGLDPTQIVEIRNLIRRLAQNSTILFSTHILSEVEALCDRVLMLFNGRIRLDSRLDELAKTNDALLTLDGHQTQPDALLKKLPGVRAVEKLPASNGHATYRVQGADDVDLCPAIYQLAAAQQWPVRELCQDVQTLESVFNQMATAV
ncbi:MAG: ATP-binding cassette domain-containing protein [Ardenticatenaceae bacterium]|nr:ATP-binding cassette domain-containing protein [Ardenticatenaceae bacterium]MCB8987745.1 ATP-binding cassette domain-containing protein [Ardenticatenaceae bacterium]